MRIPAEKHGALFNWIGASAALAGVFLPGVAITVLDGTARDALLWIAFGCWIFVPVWMPIYAVKCGVVRQRTSSAYRSVDPRRFWIGLVTYELLAVFFAATACMFIWSSVSP